METLIGLFDFGCFLVSTEDPKPVENQKNANF